MAVLLGEGGTLPHAISAASANGVKDWMSVMNKKVAGSTFRGQ